MGQASGADVRREVLLLRKFTLTIGECCIMSLDSDFLLGDIVYE